MDKPQIYTAKVASIKNLAGDYFLGRFVLVDPRQMQFAAGQYVIFLLPPPKLRHTMSIASPPSKKADVEILQQCVAGGEGSKWFVSLQKGDMVRFTGPLGKFALSGEAARPKVFVATGSGIAPIRSMILHQVSVFRYQFSVTLYWGLRHEADVFWQNELAVLASKHPNVHYTITLSQPTDAWKGAKGRVTDHVIAETQNLTKSEFYLCGSRAMIEDMRGMLTDNGVPQSQIFTETFF